MKEEEEEGGRRTRFPREYVLSSSKVSVSKHQDAIFKKSHCEEGGYISFFWRFFLWLAIRGTVNAVLDGKF